MKLKKRYKVGLKILVDRIKLKKNTWHNFTNILMLRNYGKVGRPQFIFLGAYYSDILSNYGYHYANSFDSVDFDLCVNVLLANGLQEKIENLP